MDAENFFDLAVAHNGWAIRGLGLVNEAPGIGFGLDLQTNFESPSRAGRSTPRQCNNRA
jgi:hypothetical protein